jgi:outer membrane protein, heavy metal efflux system
MSVCRTVALPALAFIFVCHASGQEMTEQDVLKQFMERSPQATALRARIPVTRAESHLQILAPNPAVTASREDVGGVKDQFLTAEQSLPISGRLGLLKRAGKEAVSAAEQQTKYDLLLLRAEVRLAFYELLAAQQREAIATQSTVGLREIVRVLREREKVGEGSGYDALRAERELADTEALLNAEKLNVATTRNRLSQFLTGGAGQLIAKGELLPGPELPSVQDLIARATSGRGDIVAQQRTVSRFAFEQRAAERQRIPEPTVLAGLKRTSTPGFVDNGYVATVTVPLPLFNRGQTDADRARALRERTESDRAVLVRQVEAEVRSAYDAVVLRRNASAEYRKSAAGAADLSNIARLSYQEGERGILELLDAQRVAVGAQVRTVELSFDMKKAEIELGRAVGEEVLP